MNQKTPPARRRNDLVFIALLLLLAASAALGLFLLRETGDTVCVFIDGQLHAQYALTEDISVTIQTENGFNRLIIKDGYAYVADASCPDGICSSHRPIRHVGESIICLPNKVVIEIRGQSQHQPDIIT